jgi:hypothetical protein
MELLGSERTICSWGRFAKYLKCAPDHVRYLGQSGEHILPASFTARDPKLSSAPRDPPNFVMALLRRYRR